MTKQVTRIRYKKELDGTYKSVKEFFTTDGKIVKLMINPETKFCSVLELAGGEFKVCKAFAYTTFTEAKTLLKNELRLYGVALLDEVRTRSKTA